MYLRSKLADYSGHLYVHIYVILFSTISNVNVIHCDSYVKPVEIDYFDIETLEKTNVEM